MRRYRRRRRGGGCLGTLLVLVILLVCAAAAGAWLVGGAGDIHDALTGALGEVLEEALEELADPVPQETEAPAGEEDGNSAARETAAEEPEFPEVHLDRGELADKYYYSLLAEEQQTVYQEILQGIRNLETEITLDCRDGEEAGKLFREVLYDWPDIFWCGDRMSYILYYDRDGAPDYLTLSADYIYGEAEIAAMQTEIEAAAAACLGGIGADATDYEKIRHVYEYVIGGMEYSETEYGYAAAYGSRMDPDNYSVYGALVRGSGVCEAYARGVQYLLQQLDIPCIFAVGTASNGESSGNHAWNIVECGGAWYEVDATWGDADTIEYGYLCCSGATLGITHSESSDYSYPACVSEDLDWYRLNGFFCETFDADEALAVMRRDIAAGSGSTVFRYGSGAACGAAMESLESSLLSEAASYLGQTYGLQRVSYRYQRDPSLNKITVYWSYE